MKPTPSPSLSQPLERWVGLSPYRLPSLTAHLRWRPVFRQLLPWRSYRYCSQRSHSRRPRFLRGWPRRYPSATGSPPTPQRFCEARRASVCSRSSTRCCGVGQGFGKWRRGIPGQSVRTAGTAPGRRSAPSCLSTGCSSSVDLRIGPVQGESYQKAVRGVEGESYDRTKALYLQCRTCILIELQHEKKQAWEKMSAHQLVHPGYLDRKAPQSYPSYLGG